MAKVVGPLHSSEARGSVSSLTYNTWRGISTVKARSGPTTQYSDAQVALRALTALATASWQSLTDVQREAWKTYANEHTDIHWTGNPQRLSGYNWYIRINVRRQILEEAIGEAPPTHQVAFKIPNLAVEQFLQKIKVTWSPALPYSPADLYLEFYVAGPLSAGRHPNLPQADRWGHVLENLHMWLEDIPSAGRYTIFVRPIHSQGTVATWERLHLDATV